MRFKKRRPEGLIKVGLFGNAASQNTVNEVFFGNTSESTTTFAGRSGQTAFTGEIGPTGVYQLGERLWLRGGYQLLWIDGVALATDQLPAIYLTTLDGLSTTGSVVVSRRTDSAGAATLTARPVFRFGIGANDYQAIKRLA